MRLIVFVLFVIAATALWGTTRSDSYNIEAVYQELESSDLVAITRTGTMIDVDVLLKKSYLSSGTYKVTLQRVGDDLYKVNNGTTYIKTRYCYQYGFNDAILKITGGYGYNIGTVEFH